MYKAETYIPRRLGRDPDLRPRLQALPRPPSCLVPLPAWGAEPAPALPGRAASSACAVPAGQFLQRALGGVRAHARATSRLRAHGASLGTRPRPAPPRPASCPLPRARPPPAAAAAAAASSFPPPGAVPPLRSAVTRLARFATSASARCGSGGAGNRAAPETGGGAPGTRVPGSPPRAQRREGGS